MNQLSINICTTEIGDLKYSELTGSFEEVFGYIAEKESNGQLVQVLSTRLVDTN